MLALGNQTLVNRTGQHPTTEEALICCRPYLEKTPMDPMKRLLALALTAATVLLSTSAIACEKHLNGHQNGSDTNLEGSKK